MRLLVTGAAGFIGSVLCVRARELGHDVVAVDNLDRGLNRPWEVTPGLDFHQHDCRGGIAKYLGGVDAVVHLAAGTGSLDRPLVDLLELNATMAERCYLDAYEAGVRALAFPTTSLALTVPDSPYVQSKEAGMARLRAISRTLTGAPRLVPLRLFNVLGAYRGMSEFRKKEVHVLPTLFECWREAADVIEPTAALAFTINGRDYDTVDGTPSRDFTHVLDVAEIVLDLVEGQTVRSPDSQPSLAVGADGTCWLGTGRTTTALQVHGLFTEFMRRVRPSVPPVPVAWGPRRAFDCGALRCDAPHPAASARAMRPAWAALQDECLAFLARSGL